MLSRRYGAAIDPSPRRPSFSRVLFARRTADVLMTCFAGAFPVRDFCLIFDHLKGYDEPEILRSQLSRFSLISADAGPGGVAFRPRRWCLGPKGASISVWAQGTNSRRLMSNVVAGRSYALTPHNSGSGLSNFGQLRSERLT
jgi:hypothetical protein